MKKILLKILFCILFSCLILFSFSACGECEHNYIDYKCKKCGNEIYTEGLQYVLSLDKETYSLVGMGFAEESEIIIPSKYKGLPVGSIEQNAFNNVHGKMITKLFIPDTVKSIGASAFYSCDKLETLTIGSGVIEIGDLAFGECLSLKDISFNPINCNDFAKNSGVFYNAGKNNDEIVVNFGNMVKKIPSYLFYSVIDNEVFSVGVTKINFNNKIESIGDSAFRKNDNITELTIPNSVEKIGERAFSMWTSLKKLTLGGELISIGDDAFYMCKLLDSVNFMGTIDKWVEVYFSNSYACPLNYAKEMYIKGDLVKDVVLTKATKIRSYAFLRCVSLESVEILSNISDIGDYAFYGCASLKTIEMPNSVKNIGKLVFSGCSLLTNVTLSDELTNIHSFGLTASPSLVYNIKGGVKYLGSKTNQYLYLVGVESKDIEEVNIENNCKFIGPSAFANCEKLKKVTLPNSLISIDSYAFSGCSALTDITIVSSVTRIGQGVFSGSKIKNIIFEKQYTWYRTTNFDEFNSKKGGIEVEVQYPSTNATKFKDYSGSYWYRK